MHWKRSSIPDREGPVMRTIIQPDVDSWELQQLFESAPFNKPALVNISSCPCDELYSQINRTKPIRVAMWHKGPLKFVSGANFNSTEHEGSSKWIPWNVSQSLTTGGYSTKSSFRYSAFDTTTFT